LIERATRAAEEGKKQSENVDNNLNLLISPEVSNGAIDSQFIKRSVLLETVVDLYHLSYRIGIVNPLLKEAFMSFSSFIRMLPSKRGKRMSVKKVSVC